MINVEEKKSKIISYIQNNGPSLPVRIAKAIEMEPVFASAILSELLGNKKIKLSNLKIGSSPLYFIEGQEQQLEEQTDNLKPLEKEAYLKLKKSVILKDEEQPPTIRVALRNIRDFAKPFKHEGKIYWAYMFSPKEEIEERLNPKAKKPIEEEREEVREKPKKQEETAEELKEKAEKIIQEEERKEFEDESNKSLINGNQDKEKQDGKKEEVPKAWEVKKEEIKEAKKKTKDIENIFEKKTPETDFLKEVKEFIREKGFEFLKEIQTEKKEIVARINLKTEIGDLNFLLIAKDKKSLTIDEIKSALQRAEHEQMPCLYIVRKEPSKKIKSELEATNLIKIAIMK